jgi:hypothetical protein
MMDKVCIYDVVLKGYYTFSMFERDSIRIALLKKPTAVWSSGCWIIRPTAVRLQCNDVMQIKDYTRVAVIELEHQHVFVSISPARPVVYQEYENYREVHIAMVSSTASHHINIVCSVADAKKLVEFLQSLAERLAQ